MNEKDWDRLLWNLQRKNCILMLGPQAVPAQHPQSSACLARVLAEELGRPDLAGQDVAHVSQQYVQSDGFDHSDLERDVVKFLGTTATPPDLHRDLAALPFYLTLSSCHDDLLVHAYRDAGKQPRSAFYNYRAGAHELAPMGTVDSPLVYYLYGSSSDPFSLVLTEADLLDFIVAVITGNPALPANIRSELGKNVTFLFLGFGMHQWYLRILLHVLQFNGRKRAFAFEPGLPSQTGLATVLFFASYRIDVINCELEWFAAELRKRFEAAGGNSAPRPSMVPDGAAPKVFLSYASEDASAAQWLYEGMQAGGLDVWMDRQGLKGGEIWDREIQERLTDSDYFVVIHSKTLAGKHFSYVNREINLALARQQFIRTGFRFIIPVQIDDGPLLPEFREIQAIRIGDGDEIAQVVSIVKRDYQRRTRARA